MCLDITSFRQRYAAVPISLIFFSLKSLFLIFYASVCSFELFVMPFILNTYLIFVYSTSQFLITTNFFLLNKVHTRQHLSESSQISTRVLFHGLFANITIILYLNVMFFGLRKDYCRKLDKSVNFDKHTIVLR